MNFVSNIIFLCEAFDIFGEFQLATPAIQVGFQKALEKVREKTLYVGVPRENEEEEMLARY